MSEGQRYTRIAGAPKRRAKAGTDEPGLLGAALERHELEANPEGLRKEAQRLSEHLTAQRAGAPK